jgi:hypothetical protein
MTNVSASPGSWYRARNRGKLLPLLSSVDVASPKMMKVTGPSETVVTTPYHTIILQVQFDSREDSRS